MNKYSLIFKLGVAVVFSISITIPGFSKKTPKVVMPIAKFNQAMSYIEAFQLDSANLVLDDLTRYLEETEQQSSAFGIQVQLKKAEALEKSDQDEAAASLLLTVASSSSVKGYWSTFTNAQLSLARLHEKHQRPEHCFKALRQAEEAITRHELDSLYSRFAIRMSSYHRIFGEKETALLYAKEAIRTASDFDQVEFLGNGHMLTAMLLKGNRPEASAYHFLKAADIFKALNNHIGYSAMLCNLSSLYKDYGEFELALKYSDDYFTAYQAGEKKDHADNWMLSNFYEIRSEIMAGMEQYDSAHHYLQLAFDSRLRLIQEENRSEVVQIEAQFNDAQKVQKIRDQAQIIEYEATKRKWGIGIAVLALLFTGVLLCFYFKLRSANHKMRLQSVLIQEKNKELGHNLEQQIMLQGEIHHRVKNNLQVIISLLELQQTDIQDPKTLDQLQSMSNRIYSMAAVHEMLYGKQGGETISLSEYTQKLCEHFKHLVPADQSLQFYLDLDASPLNIETLMPLGIVLNELMTNSLKYASLPWQELEISMHLQPCADGYCFSYQDNGPGFPEGALVEREGGLGSYLVRSMIRQLNGRVTTSNDNGAVYQIFFKEKNQSKLQNELISDTYS